MWQYHYMHPRFTGEDELFRSLPLLATNHVLGLIRTVESFCFRDLSMDHRVENMTFRSLPIERASAQGYVYILDF